MEKSLYEILGISKNASKEEITKTYKKLKFKYAEEDEDNDVKKKMSIIENAYEILSDENKRAKYDEFLREKENNKKIIEENIRSINNSDFEESINNAFELSDELELPQVEEVSKEEIAKKEEEEKKQKELEEAKQKEIDEKNRKKEKEEKKVKVSIYVILIGIVVITLVAISMFAFIIKNNSNTNKEQENTTETIKSLRPGERIPINILKMTTENGFYNEKIKMWMSYSNVYDVYYAYLEKSSTEIYYSKNYSYTEGGFWLYFSYDEAIYTYEQESGLFINDNLLEDEVYYFDFETEDSYDIDNLSYEEDWSDVDPYKGTNESDEFYIEYFENANGEICYLDEEGIVRFITDEDYSYFVDKNGRYCYIDLNTKQRYYIDDENSCKYYRDENNNYYTEINGYKYYEYCSLDDWYLYYLDENGAAFRIDEIGKRVYDLEEKKKELGYYE